MIEIPKLTQSDIAKYKENKVVLYNVKVTDMVQIYSVLKHCEINVIGFYTNHKKKFIITALMGLKQISYEKIKRLTQKSQDIVLQDVANSIGMQDFAKETGCACSNVRGGHISFSFAHLTVCPLLKNPFTYWGCNTFWTVNARKRNAIPWKFLRNNLSKEPIILCSPPKTADVTLNYTIRDNEEFMLQKIGYINLVHRPQKINRSVYEKKFKKVRIILGLREPIAQNLSLLYHNISSGNIYFDWLLGLLEKKTLSKRVYIVDEYQKNMLEHSKDAQWLWEKFIDRYIYVDDEIHEEYPRAIQRFIPAFSKHVVDITAYPFDQEKGYTIIKNGNTEIFVYQLEKLNNLVPELSEWVGVPFDKLENGNQASDKWIAESYKQAQKEIEITQEYFDKCFDEPYVKHCYSEADIEKFKARWRPHIK